MNHRIFLLAAKQCASTSSSTVISFEFEIHFGGDNDPYGQTISFKLDSIWPNMAHAVKDAYERAGEFARTVVRESTK